MGAKPSLVRISFVFEKCLQPKNPLYAENGDGWAAVKIKCLFASIKAVLAFA
ncbi:hypothetical protein D3C79_1118690 [compost metagenome]